MKIFVTGVRGQLGHDVVKELEKRGIEAVGVDIQEMDITDAGSVDRVIKAAAPDTVIHCAAYTAVDAAEDNEEACRRVNAEGPRNIAGVCRELDIPMLYISSDYVFDGKGTEGWKPDDTCNPQSVYGLTKYEGELAVKELLDKYFIVRITWTPPTPTTWRSFWWIWCSRISTASIMPPMRASAPGMTSPAPSSRRRASR